MKTRIGFLVHRSVPAQRLRDAFRLLDRMQVGCDVRVASAGLDPGGVGLWVESFARGGGEIIVAFDDAGGGLGGLAAAHTLLPVISAPILGGGVASGGMAVGALGKRGVPVAVVAGEHAADAVAFALRVLALSDAPLRKRLEADHRDEVRRLEEQGQQLQRQLEEWGSGASERSAQKPTSSRAPETSSGSIAPSSADDEMVEQFARALRPRIKAKHGPEPSTERAAVLEYSLVLREVVGEARDLAVKRPEGLVGPIHFLAAIARLPQAAAYRALQESAADLVRLRIALEERMGPESAGDGPRTFGFSPAGEELLAAAKAAAREAGRGCLTTVDILLAIGQQEDESLVAALEAASVNPERLHAALLRSDIAGAECEELEASRQDRLPKTATPLAVDSDVMQKMQSRIFAEREQSPGGAPSEPEVIDIPAASEDRSPAAPRILTINAQNPELESVEEASDALLDGRVIAMPTDTMFALMADATNPAAVERLLQIAGREPGRPVGVLVHSSGVVKSIVRRVPAGVEDLLDELWPGPLTVVFERHPARFGSLAEESTIGIRLPDHYLTLAVLSTLGRPVAAIAAGGGGEGEASAREIAARYGSAVSLVLDARETPHRVRPTVLSVAGKQFRILRPGPVTREQIEKALGQPVEEQSSQ